MNRENRNHIQLLVDGELSHDDRCQFLSTIDRGSELWCEIAVAFVEKQILDASLGGNPADIETAAPLATRQPTPKKQALPLWIAIAASLLLGLLAGTWWNSNTNAPSIAEGPTVTRNQDTTTASGNESNGGQPQLQLDEALARSVKPISLQAKRELLKAGYLIDEVPQMASVRLHSGQAIEMPIRQFNVHYLGNAAYQ